MSHHQISCNNGRNMKDYASYELEQKVKDIIRNKSFEISNDFLLNVVCGGVLK